MQILSRINILRRGVIGNTSDFDSLVVGSSPAASAINEGKGCPESSRGSIPPTVWFESWRSWCETLIKSRTSEPERGVGHIKPYRNVKFKWVHPPGPPVIAGYINEVLL